MVFRETRTCHSNHVRVSVKNDHDLVELDEQRGLREAGKKDGYSRIPYTFPHAPQQAERYPACLVNACQHGACDLQLALACHQMNGAGPVRVHLHFHLHGFHDCDQLSGADRVAVGHLPGTQVPC